MIKYMKSQLKRGGEMFRHTYVQASGRGCALEMSAEAPSEGVVARNGGQAGTGITIIYSYQLEGDSRLPGCSLQIVVLQAEQTKSMRREPIVSARGNFGEDIIARVRQCLSAAD